VTQRMITRVDASEPLGILARVVEYAEESDKAYRRADR
jgi:hypothetical protein